MPTRRINHGSIPALLIIRYQQLLLVVLAVYRVRLTAVVRAQVLLVAEEADGGINRSTCARLKDSACVD